MPATDAITLLDIVRIRRAELDHVKHLRTRREAGYADMCRAEYHLALAVQRCQDAGLLVGRRSVDTGALLRERDPGDGTYGLAL